jgi:tetratricopeptide (TPR) repeat protein
VKKTVTGLALLVLAVSAGAAAARNFHCAGGIQYVIQGTKQKDKGNAANDPELLADAKRIFGKAVAQLTTCVTEDPNDSEAWSYLGWAYAEVDSAAQSGAAFDEAIKRLANDPKPLEIARQNRKSYWVQYYNAGLSKYKEADAIIPVAEILESKDPKVDQAKAKLAESEVAYRKAVAISSKELAAYNSLAVVLALQGKFDEASTVIDQGLAIDPNDADLLKRKESMTTNNVTKLLKGGDYDGALALMDKQMAKNGDDYGTLVLAAQTSFEQAQKLEEKKDPGAKAAYSRAQGYYGRAAAVAPDAANKRDMSYNQAVAAQNTGDELMGAKLTFGLVQDNPKDKALHGMLRGFYDRLGSKKKADDEVWVILGLNDNATAVTDIAAYTAKVVKTTEAGKTLASQGPPEEVKQFKSGETQIDLWYYWSKKLCFAFTGGRQVGSANFGEFGPEGPPPAPAATPAKPAAKPATKK